MNDDNFISSSDIMMEIVDFSQQDKSKEIHSVWKNVVSKIHSYKNESENSEKRIPIGLRLAGNTRVVDLRNEILLVETDHPGWIQYLNMYKKFIIKGLKMALPELKISTLAFRVKGSHVSLSDTYDQMVAKARKELGEKMENDEKILNEKFPNKNNENFGELPPELIAKFDSIKNDMLTNSKNK